MKTKKQKKEKDVHAGKVVKGVKELKPLFKKAKELSDSIDLSSLKELKKQSTVIKEVAYKGIKISKKADIDELVLLILQTQAYKDRVLEYLLSYVRMQSKISSLKKQAVAILWKTNGAYLKGFKTECTRNIMIDDLIWPISKPLNDLDSLLAVCREININLTSTSFALKEVGALAQRVLDLVKQSRASHGG